MYEVLITEGLKARLEALAETLPTEQRALHPAEAPDRIAWARDNRGAMIRLVGSAEDGTTHAEMGMWNFITLH